MACSLFAVRLSFFKYGLVGGFDFGPNVRLNVTNVRQAVDLPQSQWVTEVECVLIYLLLHHSKARLGIKPRIFSL